MRREHGRKSWAGWERAAVVHGRLTCLRRMRGGLLTEWDGRRARRGSVDAARRRGCTPVDATYSRPLHLAMLILHPRAQRPLRAHRRRRPDHHRGVFRHAMRRHLRHRRIATQVVIDSWRRLRWTAVPALRREPARTSMELQQPSHSFIIVFIQHPGRRQMH